MKFQGIEKQKKGSLQWLEFASLHGLVHGSFLRLGGCSQTPFDSLNVGLHVGDHKDRVLANRLLIQEVLQTGPLVSMKQVHGSTIRRVYEKDQGREIEDCDALMTNEKGIALMVMHADCQAAIFYDPKRSALCVAHAGWKGLVQNIYAACIEAMIREFQSDPKEIRVAISPSLGPKHSEFRNYQKEFPQSFWVFKDHDNHFNLWDIAQRQLYAAGIKPLHLQIAQMCTYEHEQECFSYRREHTTGRLATVAILGACQKKAPIV